jgi:hypothetical protein
VIAVSAKRMRSLVARTVRYGRFNSYSQTLNTVPRSRRIARRCDTSETRESVGVLAHLPRLGPSLFDARGKSEALGKPQPERRVLRGCVRARALGDGYPPKEVTVGTISAAPSSCLAPSPPINETLNAGRE